MIIATLLAVFILSLLSLFQLSLALGAPMGKFAWGGKYKVLPRNLRIGSIYLSLFIWELRYAYSVSRASTRLSSKEHF